MATTKKNNKRKFAAVALALVGVAGLSVASAAQLTINDSDEVLIGSETLAECQTGAVSFDYDYDPNTFDITGVTVSNISEPCADEPIRVVLNEVGETSPLAVVTGTVPAGGGEFTGTVSTGISIARDIDDVVVVIG